MPKTIRNIMDHNMGLCNRTRLHLELGTLSPDALKRASKAKNPANYRTSPDHRTRLATGIQTLAG